MKQEHEIDFERIAALLDGKLASRERDRLLGELSESPEMMAVYADAVAAAGMASSPSNSERVAASVVPIRRSFFARGGTWIGIAASAIFVVGVSLYSSRARVPESDVGSVIASMAPRARGLPREQRDHGWSTVRSGQTPLTDVARSARVGALLVDLDVTLRAGDTTAASIVQEIAALLRDVPAAGPVLSVLATVEQNARSGTAVSADRLPALYEQVAGFLDVSVVSLGAWAEGVAIAASHRDQELLDDAGSRFDDLSLPDGLVGEVNAKLRELRGRLAEKPLDPDAILLLARSLLMELGRSG